MGWRAFSEWLIQKSKLNKFINTNIAAIWLPIYLFYCAEISIVIKCFMMRSISLTNIFHLILFGPLTLQHSPQLWGVFFLTQVAISIPALGQDLEVDEDPASRTQFTLIITAITTFFFYDSLRHSLEYCEASQQLAFEERAYRKLRQTTHLIQQKCQFSKSPNTKWVSHENTQ